MHKTRDCLPTTSRRSCVYVRHLRHRTKSYRTPRMSFFAQCDWCRKVAHRTIEILPITLCNLHTDRTDSSETSGYALSTRETVRRQKWVTRIVNPKGHHWRNCCRCPPFSIAVYSFLTSAKEHDRFCLICVPLLSLASEQ